MANVATTLKTLEPALPQVPTAPRQTPAPDKPADRRELEIGEAVAAAAYAIAIAVDACIRTGSVLLAPEFKDTGATRLAKVAELQLDYEGGDDDFIHKARIAGRRVLRGYFDTRVNPHLIDAAIDRAIDPVFEIVGPIIKDERVYRPVRSN